MVNRRQVRAWAVFTPISFVWAAAFITLTAGGCAKAPTPPPATPPSPKSVTKDKPGGDASDPARAALIRLLAEPFGTKKDKFNTLRASLPDKKNWRRIRFFGHPTRAGFRYGKKANPMRLIVYREAQPDDTPESCLDRFLQEAKAIAQRYGVKVGPIKRQTISHQPRARVLGQKPPRGPGRVPPNQRRVNKRIPAVRTSGRFVMLANRDQYFGAVASYYSWPGSCLIQGFAVQATPHEDLAQAVLDRWLRQGAGKLVWKRSLQKKPEFKNR